jgi:protoporphyrinogen oxidase
LRQGPDTNREASAGTAVLGGGPAGLTAAYVLGRRGLKGTVFEADGVVGGIAKTVEFKGYRFDLGGHRFFTKLKPIERLWEEILGDEFLVRRRLSRIYYRGQYFYYPLEARNVVRQLGLMESVRSAVSYVAACLRRGRPVETFEDWVTGRFGRRLYQTFFRTYTEKVWGIPGSEVRAEWAAQRIKDFSFWHALTTLLHLRRTTATTLIEEFRYPRLGPGQMWEAFRDRVEVAGIPVYVNHRCVSLLHSGGRVERVVVQTNGSQMSYAVDGVLSSIPLSELVQSLEPRAPDDVLAAAQRLRYRDLCVVALILDEEEPFPDNWVYIHDPDTRAGRVQNFGAWSESLVVPGTTCLGVEYFCFEGDDIWKLPPDEAVALATDELARIGLIDPSQVVDGVKIRVPKAYPIYDESFRDDVALIRTYLDTFENLKTFGRNGLHRYNNQDHSMWTAILATLNLTAGTDYDVWAVNTEAEYHEEGEAVDAALELVPDAPWEVPVGLEQ